jgi:hypothetical protein
VNARDDVCAFPTCNQPGYRCEYEHTTAFSAGGSTCRCNGALACRRHNQCKLDTGWNYTRNPDGSFTWTTSTGHTYTSTATIQWAAKASQPEPPRPPAPPTIEDVHAQEDTAYQRLVAKWQYELDQATEDGDEHRRATAQQALATAEHQRQQQLASRTGSDPPF